MIVYYILFALIAIVLTFIGFALERIATSLERSGEWLVIAVETHLRNQQE